MFSVILLMLLLLSQLCSICCIIPSLNCAFLDILLGIPGQRQTDMGDKLIFLTGYHTEVHKAPVWNLDKWVWQKSDRWPRWRETTGKLRDNWGSVVKPSRSPWFTWLYRWSIQSESESTCPDRLRLGPHKLCVSVCWRLAACLTDAPQENPVCMLHDNTHEMSHQCKHTRKKIFWN